MHPISIETLIGEKGATQQNMRDVPLQQIKEYAAEDADITLQLYQHLYPKLDQNQLTNLYQTIEAPLVSVLASMEYEGVRIDPQFLLDYSVELGAYIEEARKKVFDQAGVQFNIDSPKQVGDVLFGLMKIPYRWAKTKTQQFSTNEEKLSELAEKHQIAQDILHFRSLTKLKSTYVDTLPKLINPKTQRIHSSFNQAVASTGRLSSNNPNLQNIPIKTAAGIKIRQAFIPRNDDYLLLSADYSQIELRLIAHMSNDQAMIQAFNDELDIHLATAAKVYNVPLNQVTPTQRRNAKTVNFSIIYGAGAQNLSQQLDIPRAEAKELIEQYFVQYSNLKKYMDDTVAFARTHGYVQTLLGRRRHIRDIDSRNGLTRSQAERTAINTPVQGTAADLIKAAMIQIHHQLQQHNLRSKLILQVHDELVFDVYKPELNTVQSLVQHAMEHAIPNLQVPLRVSMGTGNNWREAH
jgi:DNA polymerase-1